MSDYISKSKLIHEIDELIRIREEAMEKGSVEERKWEMFTKPVLLMVKGYASRMPTIEAKPYIEFCEWVADTVLYEDFEDKWTLGAFAEVACRKLHKLGFVRKDGEYWTKDEVEE